MFPHCVYTSACLWLGSSEPETETDSCVHGLLKERFQEKESRGSGVGQRTQGTLGHELEQELVSPVVKEPVNHSPLCGGGVGSVCCNPQTRRI